MLPITRDTVQCFCRICLEEVVGTAASEARPPIHDLLKDDELLERLDAVSGTQIDQWRNTEYYPSTVCDACFKRVAKLYKFRDKMMCATVALRQVVLKNLDKGNFLLRLQRVCRACVGDLGDLNDAQQEVAEDLNNWMDECFSYRCPSMPDQAGGPRPLCAECFNMMLDFKKYRQQAQDSFKVLLDLLSVATNSTIKYTIEPVEVEETFDDLTNPHPHANEIGVAEVQIQTILPSVGKREFILQPRSQPEGRHEQDDVSKMLVFSEKEFLTNDNSGLDEETLMHELLEDKNTESISRIKISHDDEDDDDEDEDDSDDENKEQLDNNLRNAKRRVSPGNSLSAKRKKVSFGDIHYRTIETCSKTVQLEFVSDGDANSNTVDSKNVLLLKMNEGKVAKKDNMEQNPAKRQRRSKSAEVQADKNKRGKAIQCAQCDKQFRKEVIYNAHVLNVHKGIQKPFSCDQCDKVYRLYHYLQRHIRETHGIKSETTNNGSVDPKALAPHICQVCDKSFKRKEHLNEHLRSVHQGLRPFKCQYCDKTFGARKTCRIHEMGHTGDKPYDCNVCKKAFRQITDLKIHMESHNTPPERLCPICKRAKESPEELERHLREHEKSMCHKCEKCGRIFKKKSQLNAHIDAVHLKLRPFKCSFCDMSFAIPKTCRTHELVHTGARPEVCPICKKTFRQISSLRSHMKTHNKPSKPKSRVSPKEEYDVNSDMDDDDDFNAD